MDDAANACTAPNQILGYTIRSRTRIYVSYLIPAALELVVYITQIVADSAVSYQHFRSHQPDFGWATLCLILIPPFLTFVLVVTSRRQRQAAKPTTVNRWKFLSFNLLQMLLFPLFAIYRFAVRLFWSVEALFHDDNDTERMLCLAKAEECSTCELYHFIQAYGQSAPQIILQLYHMLTQDLFRDFNTTTVQAICLVFSAIDLAAITTTYQRFESQRHVGRHYPWSSPQEVLARRQLIEKNECLRRECEMKKRDSERTITSFPESDKIMENFKLRHNSAENKQETGPEVSEPQTNEAKVHGYDEVDNDAVETEVPPTTETTVLLHKQPDPKHNATDDDKIKTSPRLRFHSIREEMKNIDAIEILDTVPSSPAPPPPAAELSNEAGVPQPAQLPRSPSLLRAQLSTTPSDAVSNGARRNKRSSKTFSQLETFKDMLIINAQLYIKENVPHPPKMLTKRIDEPEKEHLIAMPTPASPASPATTPLTPKDVTDFFLPRPTKIINGIQQDDFAGKTIAFFGWILFIIMRMLALATFCVFYPRTFLILLSVHYLVMLAALCLETRFKGKLNRTIFYILLAYVYIFVLLEFRIKFKRIRLWFVWFFVITMAENICMTTLWYANEEFESWWFGFIFEGIIYSGILFMATLLVYYCILKPKEVTLIVEDDVNAGDGAANTTTT